eukprot:c20317_g1_i2 orf=183-1424(+)
MVQLEIENIKQTLAASHPGLWFRDHVRNWAGGVGHGERKRAVHLHSLHQPWIKTHEPLKRTLQFWKRSLRIYFDYKFCQLRVQFLKGKEEQDKAWEEQHESAAAKIYLLCTELGGFFLKAAQMVGKPDLAPDAWVRKLVMLCDAAPATPFSTVKLILEREGLPLHDFFEKFEGQPIGSASIAQVHRARVKGSTRDVAVKVQHPGVEELMMTDIRNLKAFAAFLQRFDIKFDLLSITDELEDQVQYEFDFVREATSMDRIADSMSIWNNGKPPVIIPRSIPGMVTRQVLVMDFIEGIPILRLEVELAKRGICADGTVARLAKRNILRDLTAAYGQMILRDGFFQADPHPGNILINNLGKVALLDYGQVKELQNSLRLDFANLVLAIASGKPLKISHCFKTFQKSFSLFCGQYTY